MAIRFVVARLRPQEALLRDLLRAEPGWAPAEERPRELEAGGRRFRLVPLAARPPVLALLCEPTGGGPLPSYAERRHLRELFRRRFPRALTVFTDGAHARQVWAWRGREPGGPLAWREVHHGLGPLSAGLPEDAIPILRLVLQTSRGVAGGPRAPRPEPEVLLALLRRVRRVCPAAFRPGGPLAGPLAPGARRGLGQAVQDAVEGTADPALLRAVWRGLEGLTVLDPACGRGGWLLRVLATLEPVYLACLERMGSWVEEAGRRAPSGPPPEDFAAAVERAGGLRRGPEWTRFVRETILARNLFGADPDARALAGAELRLRLHLGEDANAPFLGDLRAGNLRAGFATLVEVRAVAGPAGEEWLRGAREEAEALDRAERALLAMWRGGSLDAAGLLRGRRPVRERRAALSAALDRLLARREGIGPGDPEALASWKAARWPLHRCVEFFGVQRRGGFALERERAR